MVNFLQHKKEIIGDFCNVFKKDAYKKMWGISLNCTVKLPEIVWLNRELLIYQEESKSGCASGCTIQNPSYLISQYPTCTGKPVFPELFKFNPNHVFFPGSGQEHWIQGGYCFTKVIINNGSTVITYNLTVGQAGAPTAGSVIFVYPSLIGYNIQLSLSGYGFFNPGNLYTYDITTGTITLLTGLLFNIGEVYTIFAYK